MKQHQKQSNFLENSSSILPFPTKKLTLPRLQPRSHSPRL